MYVHFWMPLQRYGMDVNFKTQENIKEPQYARKYVAKVNLQN